MCIAHYLGHVRLLGIATTVAALGLLGDLFSHNVAWRITASVCGMMFYMYNAWNPDNTLYVEIKDFSLELKPVSVSMSKMIQFCNEHECPPKEIVLLRQGIGPIERAHQLIRWAEGLQEATGPLNRWFASYWSACIRQYEAAQHNASHTAPWRMFLLFRTVGERNQIYNTSCRPLCDFSYLHNEIDRLCLTIPPNPSDIVFSGADYSRWYHYLGFLVSNVLSIGLIACTFAVMVLLYQVETQSVWLDYLASAVAALVNVSIPPLIRLLTTNLEFMKTHSNAQISMLFKLVTLRVLNTGVLFYFTFDSYTSAASRVRIALITDLFISHGLRYFDPLWITLCAFARFGTQCPREQAWLLEPAEWNIADRYTDVFKTLSMGLVFGPDVPDIYGWIAVHFLVTYFLDRYLIHNRWGPLPHMNHSITVAVQFIATVLTILHMIVWIVLIVTNTHSVLWTYVYTSLLGGGASVLFIAFVVTHFGRIMKHIVQSWFVGKRTLDETVSTALTAIMRDHESSEQPNENVPTFVTPGMQGAYQALYG